MKLEQVARITRDMRWSGTKGEETAWKNASDVVAELGNVSVGEVDGAAVAGLVARLRGRGLSPSTINRKLAAASAMLSTAFELGLVSKRVSLPRLKEPRGRLRTLTPREQEALVGQLPVDVGRLVTFLADSGMRVGEALRLRPEDMDTRSALVRDSKSGRPRTVPLTARARLAARGLWPRLTQSKLTHAWNRAKKRLGWTDPEIVPHCLRHTCASRLVARGVSLPVVKEWLGHSNIQQTMRYAHVGTAQLEGARDVLEAGASESLVAQDRADHETGEDPGRVERA